MLACWTWVVILGPSLQLNADSFCACLQGDSRETLLR
jgi:hypothetical protein